MSRPTCCTTSTRSPDSTSPARGQGHRRESADGGTPVARAPKLPAWPAPASPVAWIPRPLRPRSPHRSHARRPSSRSSSTASCTRAEPGPCADPAVPGGSTCPANGARRRPRQWQRRRPRWRAGGDPRRVGSPHGRGAPPRAPRRPIEPRTDRQQRLGLPCRHPASGGERPARRSGGTGRAGARTMRGDRSTSTAPAVGWLGSRLPRGGAPRVHRPALVRRDRARSPRHADSRVRMSSRASAQNGVVRSPMSTSMVTTGSRGVDVGHGSVSSVLSAAPVLDDRVERPTISSHLSRALCRARPARRSAARRTAGAAR